jgi:tripartite-type tricarboxylate transporter receptor subunit TctC
VWLATSPQVIVVNAASPFRTLSDLVETARAKPGQLTNASVGPATTQHNVDTVMANYAEAAEYIKAGQLRALAVGSPARLEWLPEVPTVAESGYPGYEVSVWYGLFAPAGTPAAVVSFARPISRLNDRRQILD